MYGLDLMGNTPMVSIPQNPILYLVAAVILSSVLVAILNWVRSLVTVALVVFTVLTLSRYGQKESILRNTRGLSGSGH